jgi:hypothetical protein
MFEGLWLIFAGLIVLGTLLVLFIFLCLKVGLWKTLVYMVSGVLGVTVLLSALLAWGTRVSAVPATYGASGVWGHSTLTLRADHTATQEVQFMEYDQPSVAPYKQHPVQHAIIQGRWEERGRANDWFERRLVISSLMALGPYDHGQIYSGFECSYGPVMLSGLGIEVDTGADIVYRK